MDGNGGWVILNTYWKKMPHFKAKKQVGVVVINERQFKIDLGIYKGWEGGGGLFEV